MHNTTTPQSVENTAAPYPMGDGLTAFRQFTKAAAPVRSSAVFPPFQSPDLGFYCPLNWEAEPSDLVVGLRPTPPIFVAVDPDRVCRDFFMPMRWGPLLEQLQTVQQFSDSTLRLDAAAVSGRSRSPQRKPLRLAQLQNTYMARILDADLSGLSEFEFSESVKLFIRLYDELEIRRHRTEANAAPAMSPRSLNQLHCDLFKGLAHRVSAELKTSAFQKICRNRLNNTMTNIRTKSAYIDGLLESDPVLTVLRIDLGYSRKLVKELTVERVSSDFKDFLNKRRRNKIFSNERGYIWKLQNCDGRGLHYHLILFFGGDDVQSLQHLAQQVGQYWTKVTFGQGDYQDCSMSPHPYKRMGIGTVRRSDVERRAVLLDIVTYLCQQDQALKVRGARVIDQGRLK